jgi:hypothetical protein
MIRSDFGEHSPNKPSLEELANMPLSELEDFADKEIGDITLTISPSELAAISTALVACLVQPNRFGGTDRALHRKMKSAFNRIMSLMGSNKEN